MTNATLPATLSFHQTELRIIDRDGNPWITAADLARALGYKRPDQVSKIYRNNADEFTDNMTLVLKLSTNGSLNAESASNGFGNGVAQKDTRIFSTRGCHLIAMFARTPLAKEFRRWVLDVLDQLPKKHQAPILPRPIVYPESFHSLNFRALVVVRDGNHAQTIGLEPDAMAISPGQIPALIRSHDIHPAHLPDILQAASETLLAISQR
tara:strand:+ start:37909 stop:38535 length:627 start_codon:yes stop_codon:yes gene_type:complete